VVFEPTPDVLVVLRRNIEQNGLESRIRIVDAALAATDGTARLFARGTAACGNTIAEAVYASDPHAHDAGAVTTVQTVRLSSFLSSGPIVLKLDIEGNEGDVMRELVSSGTLTRIDEIVMEYHYLPGNASNDLALMLGLLRDAGFAYQIFVEEFVPGTARALEREGNYPLNIRAIRSLASVAA
jgi:FkbM family methyltransferase